MIGFSETQSLLESIYKSATDFAIVTLNQHRIITSWNTGAENLTGFKSSEVFGKLVDLLFTPEDTAAHIPEQECNKAGQTGRAEDVRWHMRKDGSRFWANGVMTLLWDEQDKHIGYLKIFRDETEKRQLAMDLTALKDSAAKKADR